MIKPFAFLLAGAVALPIASPAVAAGESGRAGMAPATDFGRAALASAAAARLGGRELERINRGETIFLVEDSGRGDRKIRFAGAIGGHPDEVFGALASLDRYAEVLPAYFTESSFRSKIGDEAVAHFRFRTYWPFPDRDVLNRYALDPERRTMAWWRIGGSVLKNDGTVSVKPFGPHRSLVDFRVAVDPGIPFIPAWIFDDWAARQVVPGVLVELERYLTRTRTASR